MESGTAYFSNGLGLIDTRRLPSPVKFSPATFPKVGPGPVLFLRVQGRLTEAAEVINASQMAPLLAVAGPAHRFTRTALALLEARTAEVVAKCANERDPTRADYLLKEAERTWSTVASLQSTGKVRIGIKAVREALDALALNVPKT